MGAVGCLKERTRAWKGSVHVIRRIRHLSLGLASIAAGAAVAVAVPEIAPGDGPPSSASFTAVDFAWNVTGSTAHAVTIATGGTVTFGYPSGRSAHNADFSGGSAPTSCTQTAGSNTGATPPLPATPKAAGWSGTCRFDAPGRYAFHCDLHPTSMKGTIDVVATTATTGTTATSPGPPLPTVTTTVPPPSTPSNPTPGGSSGRPLAHRRASVAHRQRGAILHGTVKTAVSRSRVVVTALISNRVLAARPPRHVRKVRVGSDSRRATAAAVTSFAVMLDADARAALHRRHRLVVKLRIVVTPPGGRSVATTATVVLRERRASAGPASLGS
jgi:plastocyanin